MRSRKVRLVALGLAALFVLPVVGLALHRSQGIASEGDYVAFHISAFDPDGQLVWTSDPERAHIAILAGNERLERNLSHATYQPRLGFLSLNDPASGAVNPSRFLLGHREGDAIRTPLIQGALGEPPRFHVNRLLGPFNATFTVNDTVWTASLREANAQDQDRKPFAGAEFLYAGTLPAIVRETQEDQHRIEILATEGAVVYSRPLGFHLTIRANAEGRVVLEPILTRTQAFETEKCGIPIDLPPGKYVVLDESEDGFVVVPQALHALQTESFSFEFRILSIDKWPELRLAAAWTANLLQQP